MEKSTALLEATSMMMFAENMFKPNWVSLTDWGCSIELKLCFEMFEHDVIGIQRLYKSIVSECCSVSLRKRKDLEREYVELEWRCI